MIQDRQEQDSLTACERQLLYWHRLLVHMDFEKIKDFARKGFLPKETETFKTPLCLCCFQAKQTSRSTSSAATGSHIKSGNV